MSALKAAVTVTLVCAIALVVMGVTLVGTMSAFLALGLASEGWMLIASLVWCLEMVFALVFCMEYFD